MPQYGYTGREPDVTGLIYYRARYYDPTIGRFISRDPAGMPDGINQYAYVRNNPVNFTDPLGLYAKRYNPNSATPKISYAHYCMVTPRICIVHFKLNPAVNRRIKYVLCRSCLPPR
ncbi:MAG: RHS repeat-associated core domain-containing protein [Gammaproteobacteria bacterium]|nr:RHS repeat-associated core domain-containing protein [Gammaproteobacteria bacterium]